MAFIDQNLGSRRAISVSAVVTVHLAIGYALVTGLAYEVFKRQITDLPIVNYPEPKAPPIRHHEKLKIDKKVTTVEHPLVDAHRDRGTTVITDTGPKTRPLVDDGDKITSPPQLSRTLQPGRDHASWVTPDDYPPSAVRNEEEGPVGISVRVGSSGRVLSCQVTASSGHTALDQATCRYYSKRAKFTPALSADGIPVESSYADRVVWRLPEQ